ncbi:hypothetical protein KR054_010894 [Drosophila jambulina]|nr:hypothetical protein KR054_010894 [Drosophila jambulina]
MASNPKKMKLIKEDTQEDQVKILDFMQEDEELDSLTTLRVKITEPKQMKEKPAELDVIDHLRKCIVRKYGTSVVLADWEAIPYEQGIMLRHLGLLPPNEQILADLPK